MKILVQRVRSASVEIAGKRVAAIDRGLLLLVGFGVQDAEIPETSRKGLLEKVLHLRLFPDPHASPEIQESRTFEKSLREISAGLLLVPQFTLYGSCHKGRRPDFADALTPGSAEQRFAELVAYCQTLGLAQLGFGVFGAHMQVALENDGPVTFLLETEH